MAGYSLLEVAIVLLFAIQPYLCYNHNNRINWCYDEVCNQHSDHCNSKDGCRLCMDNTQGQNCHLCKDGYYGNATLSKDGCKRCPCPYIKSNGTCVYNLTARTFKCFDCKQGYTGDLCSNCTTGRYKNLQDGICRPCNCNGFGNTSLVQQCEPQGGHCYQCLNNTAGRQCEACLPGYYVRTENSTRQCVKCDCNGNEKPGLKAICNWKSGICFQCTSNTTGVRCEKCASGYKGDALRAKNCTRIHDHVFVSSPAPSKSVLIALVSTLSIIIALLIAVVAKMWMKRKKSRDPLGFITINMNHSEEDDYNIAWIDPVTGDPIRHHDVDTQMPLTNGNLQFHPIPEDDHDDYNDEDDLGDAHEEHVESRDTDRML